MDALFTSWTGSFALDSEHRHWMLWGALVGAVALPVLMLACAAVVRRINPDFDRSRGNDRSFYWSFAGFCAIMGLIGGVASGLSLGATPAPERPRHVAEVAVGLVIAVVVTAVARRVWPEREGESRWTTTARDFAPWPFVMIAYWLRHLIS